MTYLRVKALFNKKINSKVHNKIGVATGKENLYHFKCIIYKFIIVNEIIVNWFSLTNFT